MALLSISNRSCPPAPVAVCWTAPEIPVAEPSYRFWVSAYTPAVCVSFTVPTLAVGKLLVCLEN
ncbi:hypothetical protein I550_0393 [Mycobacterium intracellulare 1956]|uniref:Uncharacterized protein n=1 Tax=Mycobacterium intracellulare 1956 TaxID=1299331 RepID=X8CLP4_MYCIT|nr:hypothetical protein I550_0393 [Mycobacterium intracellulare 1956]